MVHYRPVTATYRDVLRGEKWSVPSRSSSASSFAGFDIVGNNETEISVNHRPIFQKAFILIPYEIMGHIDPA